MNLKPFGRATKEAIEELERIIGFPLPDDYKKFLRAYNGGTSKIRYRTFFVKGLNQEIPLDVLYGIKVKTPFDLIECYEEFEEDLLPNSLIIGDDPGGGFIVLITSPEHNGIYYWDHSFYFPQSSEENNIYKIADHFGDFLQGLKHPTE